MMRYWEISTRNISRYGRKSIWGQPYVIQNVMFRLSNVRYPIPKDSISTPKDMF